MNSYCENCGCKVYRNGCVNCNEIEYIEEQYHDLDMAVPESVGRDAADSRKRRGER